MSGILEKLHLKHANNAATQPLAGQPLAGQHLVGQPLVGQQYLAGQPQPLVGQQFLAGQPIITQQSSYVQNGVPLTGAPLTNVGQPMMTGAPIISESYSSTTTSSSFAGGSLAGASLAQPLMTGQQSAFVQTGAPLMGQQTGFVQTGAPLMMGQQQTFVEQSSMAMQHETIVKPTIVEETVRTDRIIEVQPVIHKEIDQTIVHHVEKHITEAPAANRGGVVQMAPIIQETVVRHEVDEIQPVVHREVATSVVERVEEHKSERIVAPTQHTNQVLYENSGSLGAGLVKTTTITTWEQVYPGQTFPMGQFGYPRLTREQKASRFEQKALEWERRGDLRKAQKNREKALRHRQYLTPGYVAQPRPQNFYMDKLHRLEQQQQLYSRNGNSLKAQRSQQRADRLRQKHNMPLAKFPLLNSMAPGLAAGGPLPTGRAF